MNRARMKPLPLFANDITICEQVASDAPPLLARAIGFAGRLAADAGATVYQDNEPLLAEPDEMRQFLSAGKVLASTQPTQSTQRNPATGFCIAASDSPWPDQSIPGVLVEPLPLSDMQPDQSISELTIQARSGICDLIGEPDREPLRLGGQQAAFATGYAIYAALCGVVLSYQRFGQIERARVDPLSVMAWVNWKSVLGGGQGEVLKREGRLAEWPILGCADGHVAMVFTEKDWPQLVNLIDDPALRDDRFATHAGRAKHRAQYQSILAAWVAVRTKGQLSDMFEKAGMPTGIVATVDDLLTDPLLAHRQAIVSGDAANGSGKHLVAPHRASVQRSERSTKQPRSSMPAQPALPLSGLRVVDLGIITAGAGASALLADLGAEVIKVESRTQPDPFRHWAGQDASGSPMFRQTNRNKLGAAIDLKDPAGREQFFELVASADIVLENFRRGVIERLGIGFDALVQANPNILLVSLTALGLTGPGSQNASFGSAIEARSGIASLTGYPDDAPVVSGRNLNYPDQIACMYGAATAAAAVSWQRANAGAMHLDISQRDLSVFTIGDRVIALSRDGQSFKPSGNVGRTGELQGIFPTADKQWLAITIDPTRIKAITDRCALAHASEQALAQWVAQHSLADALSTMTAQGVACASVQSGDQVFRDAAVNAGPAIGRTPDNELAKGFPFQFERVPMQIHRSAPAVGEHDEQVLTR